MKRILPILIIFFMLISLAGCSSNVSDVEPTPTSFLDFLHAVVSLDESDSHELDNSALNEDEYRLRRVINSLSMYKEGKGNQYEVDTGYIKKYGIDNFTRSDDWYSFQSIEDMTTVLRNPDFQQDFFELYEYNLGIDAYYLPLSSLMEKYSADINSIKLIVWEDDYNLTYDVGGYKDHSFFSCDIYYTKSTVDLKKLMEFYAGVDGQELYSAVSDNGTLVYYMSTDEGSVFFEDVGTLTDSIITAYIWQQDKVIGVMIWPGEFSEENLDLCVLERHEI
jgi:hypothetical protein